MSSFVKRIECTGIYDRFDLALDFQPGVNIVYGRNGAGKTTLVHVLANALNAEYSRFLFLDFDSVRIFLDDAAVELKKQVAEEGEELVVTRDTTVIQKLPVAASSEAGLDATTSRRPSSSRHRRFFGEERLSRAKVRELEQLRREASPAELREWYRLFSDLADAEPVLRAAYFPAFRTMIDAWASAHQARKSESEPGSWTEAATRSARRWFGRFTPSVNFPSLLDIEKRLADEIGEARRNVWRADREYPSQAFLDIFASLSEGPEQSPKRPQSILREIKALFDRLEDSPLHEESTLVTKVYSELRDSINELDLAQESERTALRILDIYRDLLEKMVAVQERSFAGIQRYLESVDEFLEGKRLVVDPSVPPFKSGAVGIRFRDGTLATGLRALSSGERQIVTMIYAASHMSEQQVVLIDEPEISLHVDWQRRLLTKMSQQIGERQIIACTHSPVIGADYEDRQIELVLTPTKRPGDGKSGGRSSEEIRR